MSDVDDSIKAMADADALAKLAKKIYMIGHPKMEDRLVDGRNVEARKATGWKIKAEYDSMADALEARGDKPAKPVKAVAAEDDGDEETIGFHCLQDAFHPRAWSRAKRDLEATYDDLPAFLAAVQDDWEKVCTAIYGLTENNILDVQTAAEEAIDEA